MTPKELLFAHRYSEAAQAYRSLIIKHPEDNYAGGLGRALLCLGHFAEAAASFRKSNEAENRELKGNLPYLEEIGTALWLAGDKVGGMAEWHRAVSGILDRSIRYGDLAGGATQGLLLWYGAVSINERTEHEYALQYMRHLKKRKTHGTLPWPRSIVLMVLGECSFEEILKDGVGSPDLESCINVARTDLLKRRQLCQALFYGACRERELGNKVACMKKMRICFQLENPIIEAEWYLARGECDKKRPTAN